MNVRVLLIAAIALGVAGALRLVAGPIVRADLPERADVAEPTPTGAARVSIDSLGAVAGGRDAFRFTHRPAPIAYDPLRSAEPLAPPLPKPALVLVGLVDGTERAAVIEGLPGVEGSRVLRVGDVVATLRVKEIARNRVVIVGMDTTWVLTVREPWRDGR